MDCVRSNMNYEEACNILEISQKYTPDMVKKAYFRMALRYHPDKYKEDDGEKFRKVKEAYDFLSEGKHDYVHIDDKVNYKDLIKMCVKFFSPETNWDNLFMDTSLHGILQDCEKISVKVFEKLNKEKANQVYEFLSYYNRVFGINEELLEQYKEILQKKNLHENIFILNPSLEDLFNDNIFKLEMKDKTFYVPLWHHELHFSLHSKDLIVKCEPELSKNMWIDHKNNLYVCLKIKPEEVLQDGFYTFTIGEKNLKIDGRDIKLIKEKQVVILFNQGLLRINEEHMYDDSLRSDIHVEIMLV